MCSVVRLEFGSRVRCVKEARGHRFTLMVHLLFVEASLAFHINLLVISAAGLATDRAAGSSFRL